MQGIKVTTVKYTKKKQKPQDIFKRVEFILIYNTEVLNYFCFLAAGF